MSNYVAYYRVSTQKQNASHLGLEAQRKTCGDFVRANNGVVVYEFTDVESGKSRNRKGLFDAIEYCKNNDCALVVAKLDRLARDVEFTFKIMNTGIDIHFCDMPIVNTMILGVFASVAQYERELISYRTKAALKVAKEKGKKLGAPTTDNIKKAQSASAEARIERAKNDDKNIEFKKWLDIFEEEFGVVLKRGCESKFFEMFAERLNKYDKKTSTGKDWNKKLVYEFTRKIKNRYGIAW